MAWGYTSQSEIIYKVSFKINYYLHWQFFFKLIFFKNSGKIKHSLIGMDTDIGKDLEIPYKPQCSKNEKNSAI